MGATERTRTERTNPERTNPRGRRLTLGALTLGALTLGALTVGASTASAQMSTGELIPANERSSRTPDYTGSRIAGELSFFTHASGSRDAWVFAPAVYGTVRLASLGHGADFGLDFAMRSVFSVISNVHGYVLNPYVGVHVGIGDEHLRARFGGGLVIPVLNAYDNTSIGALTDLQSVQADVIPMAGWWDRQSAEFGYLPFVARFDLEWRGSLVFVGGDGGVSLYAPVLDDRFTDGAITLQLGVFAGLRPVPGLAFGLRAQGVYHHSFFTSSLVAYDQAQLALVPFVRGELGLGFVEGRLLMNLDSPDGFAFDSGKVWAMTVLGGVNF